MMTENLAIPDPALLDPISLLALVLVVLVGLPHGAFDGAIARHLGFSRAWRGLALFVALYTGLAVAVVAVWIWQPGLALAAFLIMSAIHFGFGDANAPAGFGRAVQILAHGGVAIFGISLFHLDKVMPIFAVLTNGDTGLAVMMVEYFPLVILPVILVYLFLAMRDASLRPRVVELALLCLLLTSLPPLVGFAFYFCIIHTGRHMHHIWRRVRATQTPRSIIRQAALFTIASWGAGAAVMLWLDSGNIDARLLQVIFIGLAALTVPHMILVDGLFRQAATKDVR